MLVLIQYYLVLFVVVVIVSSLLSLLIVYSYLLVTGTVFVKQIQVCNAGSDFVHEWRICFLVVGDLFVGFVWFSLEVHACHGVDYQFFCCFFLCLIVCHSVAWVLVMLYESSRR